LVASLSLKVALDCDLEVTFAVNAAAAPNFRCLPDRVIGIPIPLDILDFAAEMPKSRFQENPPRFTVYRLFLVWISLCQVRKGHLAVGSLELLDQSLLNLPGIFSR